MPICWRASGERSKICRVTPLKIMRSLRAISICVGACLLMPALATVFPTGPSLAADAGGEMPSFGMTLVQEEGTLIVRDLVPNGPAYRAGVRLGDTFLSIDGVRLKGATFEQVRARLTAPRADAVTLQVRRRAGGNQELRLKRPAPNAALTAAALAWRSSGALDAGQQGAIPGPQSTGRSDVIGRGTLHVGDDLIDFTLPRLGGGEVTLSEFTGKPILLDFWATWCGPCRAAAPGLAAITTRFGDKIQIIGINMDSTPGMAIQYAQGAGLTYPHAFSQGWEDPVIREYGIHLTGIPFNILFDAQGRVAAMDLHGQPLADALELLLHRE